MRQQFHPSSAKNLFRKQKSIDLNDKPVNDSKKILRKQLSVDHVTSGLKHASQTSAPINFGNLLWRNSTQSLNNEPNLRIVPTNAVSSQAASSKRAQFAASSINASSVLSKWVPWVGNSIKSSSFSRGSAKKFPYANLWSIVCVITCVLPELPSRLIYCRCYSANCTFIFLFHFLFIHKNSVAGVKCAMGVRQELLTDCLNKSMKSVEATKTRVNINIFLSHDVPDDTFSDVEGTDNQPVSSSENSCLSAVI